MDKLDRERLNLLEKTLESIQQGIVVCNEKGEIVAYNKAYGEVDGLLPDDVIFKTIDKCYTISKSESTLHKVMKSKKPLLSYRQHYTTRIGKAVDVVKDTYPIIDDGEVLGAVAVVRDFSNAKLYADNITREIFVKSNSDNFENVINFSKINFNNKLAQANIKKINRALQKFCNISIFGKAGTECKEIAKFIAQKYAKSERIITFNCALIGAENQAQALFGLNNEKSGILFKLGGEVLILENVDLLTLDNQILLQTHIYEYNPKLITVFNKTPTEIFKQSNLQLELYYLLNNLYINVLNINEHKEDIPIYINNIIDYFAKRDSKKYNISISAYRLLTQHDWHGNYLELLNVLRSSAELAESGTIDIIHLPEYIAQSQPSAQNVSSNEQFSRLNDMLEYTERQVLKAAMIKHDNNITKASAELGISRQNLQYRLKKFNL